MKELVFSPLEARLLQGLAGFGFLVPNGLFLYASITRPETVRSALENPIAAVFIGEAFFLMLLFAWLLRKVGASRPGPWSFIALSLIGSLAFSVPLTLERWFRKNRRNPDS